MSVVKKVIRTLLFVIYLIFLTSCNETEKNNEIIIYSLQDYAVKFEPSKNNYDKLSSVSSNVIEVLNKHSVDSTYKACVVLVLLKIYRHEYKTFHQGYELRNSYEKNYPFVDAFFKLANIKSMDHFTAREAYLWVKKNPEYLNNIYIQKEVSVIDSIDISLNSSDSMGL